MESKPISSVSAVRLCSSLSTQPGTMEETSEQGMVLSHRVKDQVHRGQESGERKQSGCEMHSDQTIPASRCGGDYL